MPRFARFLVVAVVTLLACDRGPAAIAGVDADAVASEAAAVDGLLAVQGDPGPLAKGGSLTTLFGRALEKVTKEQGAEAATKLAAPVRELLTQAERAAKAGDAATASAKLAEARTQSIKIIVTVLGRDAVAGYITEQSRRADELKTRLEAAAKAGQDVAAARDLVARIDAGLKTASTRLAAGDLTGALDAASAAADLFPPLLRALQPPAPTKPAVTPPGWSVTGLFSQAITAISRDKGEAAAREIRMQVEQLTKAAEVARRAGDSVTAARKQAEARALMLKTVVDALGKPAVEGAIKAADTALSALQARIAAAAAAGKDVKSAREVADKAAALLSQAKEKLAKGELVGALDLANQAGELITAGGAAQARPK